MSTAVRDGGDTGDTGEIEDIGIEPAEVAAHAADRDTVFISYRRTTSASISLVELRLKARYSRRRVFRDTEDLGQHWPERLEESIRSSRVMVPVMSDDWDDEIIRRAERHESGERRDWVRFELNEANRHGVAVVPILLDRDWVDVAALPDDLGWLDKTQMVSIDTTTSVLARFSMFRPALTQIDEHLPWHARRLYRWAIGLIVAAAMLTIGLWGLDWWRDRQIPEFARGDRVVLVAPGQGGQDVSQDQVDDAVDDIVESLEAPAADLAIRVERLSHTAWQGQGRSDPVEVLNRSGADLVMMPRFATGQGELHFTVDLLAGRIEGAEPLEGKTVRWVGQDQVIVDTPSPTSANAWSNLSLQASESVRPVVAVLGAFNAFDVVDARTVADRLTDVISSIGRSDQESVGLFLIMRANAYLQLAEFQAARADYELASTFESTAERGRLGVVYLHVATARSQGCTRATFADARAGWEQAAPLVTSAVPSTRVKALTLRAQAEHCMGNGLRTGTSLDERIEFYRRAVAHIDRAADEFEAIALADTVTRQTMAVGQIVAADALLDLDRLGAAAEPSRDDQSRDEQSRDEPSPGELVSEAVVRLGHSGSAGSGGLDVACSQEASSGGAHVGMTALDLASRPLTKFEAHWLMMAAYDRLGAADTSQCHRTKACAAYQRYARTSASDPEAVLLAVAEAVCR